MYMNLFIADSFLEIDIGTEADGTHLRVNITVAGCKLRIPKFELREGKKVDSLDIEADCTHADLAGYMLGKRISDFGVL